jgi:hypothetical protein
VSVKRERERKEALTALSVLDSIMKILRCE